MGVQHDGVEICGENIVCDNPQCNKSLLTHQRGEKIELTVFVVFKDECSAIAKTCNSCNQLSTAAFR